MFTLIKPNIDSANKRYISSVENGKKGGRPKTQLKPKNNLNNRSWLGNIDFAIPISCISLFSNTYSNIEIQEIGIASDRDWETRW